MDAQLIVIVAGIVLVVVIVASLLFMRSAPGRFRFDTAGGTRPRASEGEGNTPGVAFRGRFIMLTAGVGAVFAAIVAKLWSMQMVSSDTYEEMAEQNRTRTVTTPAPRGRILDRNGKELVRNRESLAVTAYRDFADDELAVRHLANVLGMPYAAVRRAVRDNTEGAQSAHTVAQDVSRRAVAYIQEHIAEFDGVDIAERTQRLYPYGTLAAHVLGYTGSVTQEQLDDQDDGEGAAIKYQSGDIVGQAGVESRYESALQGVRGEQVVRIDSAGNVISVEGTVDPEPGSDIMLTIDASIQKACEDGLEKAIDLAKEGGYEHAGCGACICLDPTNGEVLGLASAPSFDPSQFVGGIPSDLWEYLQSEESNTPLMNRAIAGQYMSASTIKPLSALAGLEYGITTPETTTVCTGFWTGLGEEYGQYCWLHSGHGPMNLRNGIVNSCDPVFYEIGKGFYYSDDNPEGLQETFRRWGLGEACGIDLSGEASGRVPDAKWKAEWFADGTDTDRKWMPGDMTNLVIGQGDLLVTPLQMACAYAGISQDGVEWTPHVLKSVLSRDGSGNAVEYEPKERLTASVNDESELELVQSGLQGVIYEESEAQASHFRNLSVTVAGKTGTGEKSGEDEYAWFCAYAPADDPKYVVVATLEQGGFGSATALHAVRHVLGVIYDEPDTSTASTSSDQTR